MKTHQLKIKDIYWERLIEGEKNCEVRLNDRDYQKGDHIQFSVHSEDTNWCPTELFEITHVLYFPDGLKDGYVCLSLKKINPQL